MDDSKLKDGLNIAVSELFVGPAVALGAVLCLEKLLPEQMASFKRFVAKNIVEPNLKSFEDSAGPALKAYDKKNEEELGAFGTENPDLPNKPYKELSPKQRSYKIADIVTKIGVAFVAEGVGAFASQAAINRLLGTTVNSRKTLAIDIGTHAAVLGGFMTFLSPLAEPVKETVADILVKTTGMKREKAKDAARIFTYVNVPGWIAFLMTLSFGLNGHGKQK